ncbi:MAG TPA: hypothetical protein VHS27_18115 [Gaiellales bacterium]|jgi:hypothetical protein|nr:hypothetical protein [Gaiellales bacterium]
MKICTPECRAARAALLREARWLRAAADEVRDTDPRWAAQLEESAKRRRAEAKSMREDPVLAAAKVERWNNPPTKTTAKVTAAHPHGTYTQRQTRNAPRSRERRPTARRSSQRRAASSTARGSRGDPDDSPGDPPPSSLAAATRRVEHSGNLEVLYRVVMAREALQVGDFGTAEAVLADLEDELERTAA